MDVFGGLRRLLGLADTQQRAQSITQGKSANQNIAPIAQPVPRKSEPLWGMQLGIADKPFFNPAGSPPVSMPKADLDLPQQFDRELFSGEAPTQKVDNPYYLNQSQPLVIAQPTYRKPGRVREIIGKI